MRRWSTRRRVGAVAAVWALAVAAGTVAGLAVAGRLRSEAAPARAAAATGGARGAAAGMVLYRDAADGLSIALPASWRPVRRSGAGIALTARGPRGTAMMLRVARLRFRAGGAAHGRLRALAEQAVAGGRSVRFLAQARDVRLGGLHGWYYLYSFRDPRSGRRGVHAHYVLFRGRRMVELVLQALPESAFQPAAATFDRIAATLRAR